VLRTAQTAPEEIEKICPACMTNEEAEMAARMPTVIRKLTGLEYERLYRHGFEVADYTLFAYHPEEFNFFGYAKASANRLANIPI
jgi:hypothetical protein